MRDYQHFLFFSNNIGPNNIELDPSETHHITKVLRLKQGDLFNVSSGNGTIYTCRFIDIFERKLTGRIVEMQRIQRHSPHINLYIGITERDALELLLVNCTALGITRVTPIITENCRETWHDTSWKKHGDRFRNKMISAMKQSLYPFLPVLDQPMPFATSFHITSGTGIVADFSGKGLYSQEGLLRDDTFNCFIGPPGGFTEKEMSTLESSGFAKVRIAPTRLRTELAAVVLCAQLTGSALS